MLPTLFERFVEQSPVSVMLRGLMERIFIPHRLDRLFHDYAQLQYERELLFSSVVELMSLVVCSIYPSVYAAYRAQSSIVPVSASAFYSKLNGIEPQVTAALLRETATELANLINELTGLSTTWNGRYRLRVLDGNCLSATDHRLGVLRPLSEAAMPGKSLVVLDPMLHLAVNIFPCEDGHASEQALLTQSQKPSNQTKFGLPTAICRPVAFYSIFMITRPTLSSAKPNSCRGKPSAS